jgi:hypothetical protein
MRNPNHDRPNLVPRTKMKQDDKMIAKALYCATSYLCLDGLFRSFCKSSRLFYSFLICFVGLFVASFLFELPSKMKIFETCWVFAFALGTAVAPSPEPRRIRAAQPQPTIEVLERGVILNRAAATTTTPDGAQATNLCGWVKGDPGMQLITKHTFPWIWY